MWKCDWGSDVCSSDLVAAHDTLARCEAVGLDDDRPPMCAHMALGGLGIVEDIAPPGWNGGALHERLREGLAARAAGRAGAGTTHRGARSPQRIGPAAPQGILGPDRPRIHALALAE